MAQASAAYRHLFGGIVAIAALASAAVAQQEPSGPSFGITDDPGGQAFPAAPGSAAPPLEFPGTGGVGAMQMPDGLGTPLPGPDPYAGDFGTSSRVPAQQALQTQIGPQFQGDYPIRLTQAPKMLGDFFGITGSQVVVGEHHGEAVHQTIASGSAFANDNLSLITTDAGTLKTVFVGGPAGLATGSYFLPSIAPPLDDVVTGLTANGTDGTDSYTAVLTPATTDVFDNPADALPSIPDAPIYNIFEVSTLYLPTANPGDLVGRVRMQDNNSAMPQDRFYFDYNYFHNVRFTDSGFGVNRFVPGFEKTFWGGLGSVELRLPMAATLNSDVAVGGPADTSNYEFGNLTVAPKLLLWASDEEALALGMGISLPTADDINVYSPSSQVLRINNDSVHLIPYLAYLYSSRSSDYFVHAFLTVDVDTGGNDVDANVTGDGLEKIGTMNDQTLLSASGSLGKFIYRNHSRASRIKALAWTTELHYTASVNNADYISAGAFQVGTQSGEDLSLLNGTVGGHAQLRRSTVTAGYTVPLTSNDRVFDGEFRLFINRPF